MTVTSRLHRQKDKERQRKKDRRERRETSGGDPTVLDATIAKSMESVRASLANEFRHDKCQEREGGFY